VRHAWGRCGGAFSRFRVAPRNRVSGVRKRVAATACIQRFGKNTERVRQVRASLVSGEHYSVTREERFVVWNVWWEGTVGVEKRVRKGVMRGEWKRYTSNPGIQGRGDPSRHMGGPVRKVGRVWVHQQRRGAVEGEKGGNGCYWEMREKTLVLFVVSLFLGCYFAESTSW
jgi:hypothetical protein